MQRKLYSHPDHNHARNESNTSRHADRPALKRPDLPKKPPKPAPPHVMSRDALYALDMSQLRSSIGAAEDGAEACRALGHDAREWEVESCYLRRELESRMPPRRESRHEGS